MKIQEKLELINAYETAYEPIGELLEGLPAEALQYRPPISEAWTINEHLVHILDAEAAAFFRIRASIGEPGMAVPLWGEEAWRSRLPYAAQDGLACLRIVSGLRHTLAASLRALLETEWEGYWVLHSSRGRLSLTELLETYRDHAAFHEPYIRRNREAFLGPRGR